MNNKNKTIIQELRVYKIERTQFETEHEPPCICWFTYTAYNVFFFFAWLWIWMLFVVVVVVCVCVWFYLTAKSIRAISIQVILKPFTCVVMCSRSSRNWRWNIDRCLVFLVVGGAGGGIGRGGKGRMIIFFLNIFPLLGSVNFPWPLSSVGRSVGWLVVRFVGRSVIIF